MCAHMNMQIVSEREKRLDVGMRANGLKQSVYWITWLIIHTAVVLVNTLILIAIGEAVGFTIFRNVSVQVTLTLFFSLGWSMIFVAYFLSTLVQKGKTAAVVSFLVFVVAVFIQLVFSEDKIYIFYSPGQSPTLARVLSFFAPFAFTKAYSDISFHEEYYSWADLYAPVAVHTATADYETTASIHSINFMMYSVVLFAVLFWYIDGVFGCGRHPLFFLMPSFYGIRVGSGKARMYFAIDLFISQ